MQQPPDGDAGRLRRDDHRSRVPEDARPQPQPEPGRRRLLVALRQLPWREVEERDHQRVADPERREPAGRVVDDPGRARVPRPAGPEERRTAQEERIDRERAGAQEAGPRERASAGDREPVGELDLGGAGLVEDHERLARDGSPRERGQQFAEVQRRDRGAIGILERPRVEDDPDARCRFGTVDRVAEPGHLARHGPVNPSAAVARAPAALPSAIAGRQPVPRTRCGATSSTGRRGDRGT